MSIFRRLMGAGAPVATPAPHAPTKAAEDQPAVPAAPATTPVAAAPAAAEADQVPSFVCREPVLDRKERIVAYQLGMAEEVDQRLQNDFEFLPRMYDDAMLRTLAALGDGALLGSRQAFVRLAPESLDNPRIRQLPRDNTVLMLAPMRKEPDAEALRIQLDGLRQEGYAHGWLLRRHQLAQFPQLRDLAAAADYLQVDATGFNGIELGQLLKSVKGMRPAGLPALHMMAGNLNAFDEFNFCSRAGFDLFLGRFISSLENWRPPPGDINRTRVLSLLGLLRSDTEAAAIAEEVRHDPVLSFKLLRYINSPFMGLLVPVTGPEKALIVLGREKFYRWLSLLLFDFKTPGYRERALTEQALSRASFLERLAGQGSVPRQADWMFILGLFSNLDLLMGQGMEELLQQARLPTEVQEALLGRPGPHGDALQLALAAEGQSPLELQRQAAQCGLHALPVSQCAMQALAWAHEIAALDTP